MADFAFNQGRSSFVIKFCLTFLTGAHNITAVVELALVQLRLLGITKTDEQILFT